jgi:CheY-like chemotaxis protein
MMNVLSWAFGLGGACGFSRRSLPPIPCAKAWQSGSFSSTLIPSDKQPSSTSPRRWRAKALWHPPQTQRATVLRAEPFDLCIVDMNLADGGAQVISTAQACQPWTPVVALASQGTVAEVVTAFRAGASEFLPRPFHHDLAVAIVRRVLQQRASGTLGEQTTGACLHWRPPGHAGGPRTHRSGGRIRRQRAGPWRRRHRQGSHCPSHPRLRRAAGRPLCYGATRNRPGHSGGTGGVRLRPTSQLKATPGLARRHTLSSTTSRGSRATPRLACCES